MTQNLEDIAALAGVSRSTVSRVINNHPAVSERTRQKVMRVIREQNFQPNLAARALVTQETHMLSLVIPGTVAEIFADPYFPLVLQGAAATANQHDYAVTLWIGNDAEQEERFCQRILSNSLFDGILIASVTDNDPLIDRLAKSRYPLVLIGPPIMNNLNFVDVDNVRASQVAVSHLIRLGRQRIGTITGPSNMGSARNRLQGYRQAMERAGRKVDSNLITEGSYSEASGYNAMKVLLRRQVDAVFAASDMMAIGAMRAIFEQGLRIPDDIAIVGFDDMPMAATTIPALTTVRQPIKELGSVAAQIMIDVLNGNLEQPYQQVMPAQLIVRESCGAMSM